MLISPPSLSATAHHPYPPRLCASYQAFECLNSLRGPANAIRPCRHPQEGGEFAPCSGPVLDVCVPSVSYHQLHVCNHGLAAYLHVFSWLFQTQWSVCTLDCKPVPWSKVFISWTEKQEHLQSFLTDGREIKINNKTVRTSETVKVVRPNTFCKLFSFELFISAFIEKKEKRKTETAIGVK